MLKDKLVSLAKAFLPVELSKIDIFTPFELPIKILRVKGNWITHESSLKYKIFCVILHLYVMELGTVVQLLYLPYVKGFFDFTLTMTILPSSIGVNIETLAVFWYKDEIFELMDLIRDCVHEYGLSDRFKGHLMVIDRYMKSFLLLTITSITAFTISAFGNGDVLFRMWAPFDMGPSSYGFWFAIPFQMGCTYNYALVNFILDTFPVIFMVYIIGMLEQLCEKLEGIRKYRILNPDGTINESETVDNRQELINCIEHHLKIAAINRKVERVFSVIFLVRGFLSMIVLCTTLIAIVVLSDAAAFGKLSSYIVLMLVSIFVPCYYGSRIKEVSSRISDSLFHSEWMFEDKEYRQYVRIAMEFSERNLKIRTCGTFDVDLENFSLICQTVYSLYCICEQMI